MKAIPLPTKWNNPKRVVITLKWIYPLIMKFKQLNIRDANIFLSNKLGQFMIIKSISGRKKQKKALYEIYSILITPL